MQGYVLNFNSHHVLCREGDPNMDIYFLKSGKLLVCTVSGKEVKVLSRISAGEFIGELSFFDGHARSSNIITLEKCTLIQIPRNEIHGQLPSWFNKVCKDITKRIRLLDHVIQDAKIRISDSEDSKPLSIDEQRKFYDLITHQDA